MKCTTGLSAHQFAELTQWISQSKPLHTIPAILGVAGSLQATLTYLRHNLPQAAIGELLGVSHPTVSRAVKALTELVTRALDGYLITAEEVAPGCDYVVDGTLMPCWSWKAHPELWSGKHKRTGLNVQVLVTPAGRLVWVSDPCPGSTHDIAALDASGLLEGLDVSGRVADKGLHRTRDDHPTKEAGRQKTLRHRQEGQPQHQPGQVHSRAGQRPHQDLEDPQGGLPTPPGHIPTNHHSHPHALHLHHPLNSLQEVKE